MRTIRTLSFSTLKMFLRNRQTLFFTLFVPIVIMTIFGLIGFDQAPKIDVGLVSDTPTPPTRALLDQLKSVPTFTIHEGTEADERRAIENGDRSIVILVPPDAVPNSFGRSTPTSKITVLTNEGKQQEAQTAISILNRFVDQSTIAITRAPRLFQLEAQTVNSRNLKYIDFLLPGIVAMALMQMSVFSVAFVFADYKEKGILKRLLATPMTPTQFVSANVVVRLLIAFAQAAILIAVGVFLFHAHVIGSAWLLVPIVLLGALMFLCLGFVISGFANTVESVPAIANLIVFPMLFLGGTFFPTTSMPQWLQNVVQFLPLTYLSHSLREIMTRDVGLGAVKWDLLAMLLWSLGLLVFAIYTFSFEEKRV